MAFRSMFKVPKARRYDYKPRFYDERKEELEKRVSRYDRLKENDPAAIKEGITDAFRRNGRGGGYFMNSKIRQRETRRSNMILLAIIITLSAICYILLNVYLPAMAG